MSDFLSASLNGAILIGAIAALRLIFKSYLPRTAFAVLWLAALFRLLCPVRLPFPASIWSLLKREGTSGKAEAISLSEVHRQPLQETVSGGWELSEALWLFIAALLLTGIAVLYLRSLQEGRKASQIKKGVYLCKGLTSPRVCGIVRPRILLPDGIDEELMPYILMHERIHILRLDNLWKLLALTAAALHWFNPAAWLLVILLGRDLEVSCDEWVLRRLSDREKSSYALSLIAVAERCERRSPLTCGFSRNPLEERIRCIMTKKKSIIAVCAAALMILGTTAVFATDAPADKKADAAKDTTATEQEGNAPEKEIDLKGLKQYTARQYEEHVAAEIKELKKMAEAGTMSQENYKKSVRELKRTLKSVTEGTSMAFYTSDDSGAEAEIVVANVIPQLVISFESAENSGDVSVTIDEEDLEELKPGKREK